MESGEMILPFANYKIKSSLVCERDFSVKSLKIEGIVLSNIYTELIWILPWSRLVANWHVIFRSVLNLELEGTLVKMSYDPSNYWKHTKF